MLSILANSASGGAVASARPIGRARAVTAARSADPAGSVEQLGVGAADLLPQRLEREPAGEGEPGLLERVAGVLVEFLKVVIKLLFKSTSTAFVGDLANFLIGCMLVLPASVIYGFKKTKKMSRIALLTGVIVMTVFGTWFNAVYLLPTFSTLYGLPLDSIIAMGTAINGSVNNIYSFVIIMVAPMNIIKGTVVSVLTLLVYKKLSRIIK